MPIRYAARSYGETQISRFTHGWLLLKMVMFAFFRNQGAVASIRSCSSIGAEPRAAFSALTIHISPPIAPTRRTRPRRTAARRPARRPEAGRRSRNATIIVASRTPQPAIEIGSMGDENDGRDQQKHLDEGCLGGDRLQPRPTRDRDGQDMDRQRLLP